MASPLPTVCQRRFGRPVVPMLGIGECRLKSQRTKASKAIAGLDLSNPKPGHPTGGARRGRAGRGEVGWGETRQGGAALVSDPQYGKRQPWTCMLKQGRIKFYGNRIRVFGERFIRGAVAALRSWLLTIGPTPVVFLRFLMQGMSGNFLRVPWVSKAGS